MSKVYALAKQQKKVSGGGSTESWWLELLAVGKTVKLSGWQQWVAANEYICATLGTMIGLPVPPFAMLEKRTSQGPESLWFASLDYRLAGETMPAIDPETVFSEVPEICAGVIVFDLWIANTDRHDGNLTFDPITNPKRLNVFDHSHALFGSAGSERLNRMEDKFTLTQDAEPHAFRHCLLDVITDFGLLENWIRRINMLPVFQISEPCSHMKDLGIIREDEWRSGIEFLLRRRKLLDELLHKNWGEFHAIKEMPAQL